MASGLSAGRLTVFRQSPLERVASLEADKPLSSKSWASPGCGVQSPGQAWPLRLSVARQAGLGPPTTLSSRTGRSNSTPLCRTLFTSVLTGHVLRTVSAQGLRMRSSELNQVV